MPRHLHIHLHTRDAGGWEESKHPRSQNGQFGSGGAESAGAADNGFGPVLTNYRHNAGGAVKKLMGAKTGDAVGALHHPDVGDIDLVWGKPGTPERKHEDGFGLAKIAQKHPEVLGDLQGLLQTMKKVPEKSGKNRIQLESPTHAAAIRLDWNGQTKHWLLTAFKKEPKRK